MFVDTESLKSSESSVFEPNPESPDQRLIRKSIKEESLLANSDAQAKGEPESQLFGTHSKKLCHFQKDHISLLRPDFSNCNTSSSESVLGSRKLRHFPKLPALPGIQFTRSNESMESTTRIEPKMPNHWNTYPQTSSHVDHDEVETLALTSGYSLPPIEFKHTSNTKSKRHLVARKNILKVKIFTNINDEVFVIRKEKHMLQTLNELLGPIIRKMEKCYDVSPNSIKLFLTFTNKNLLPVELFKGDPSSCLYSSLTEEYIHNRDKILVLAEISL